MSRERVVRRGGGGKIVVAFREDSKQAQSVRAQFRVGGEARNKVASKRRTIRIWSDPVEGRGSDHSVKYGARRGQAKARSRTPKEIRGEAPLISKEILAQPLPPDSYPSMSRISA